jgi:hypothetical protein
MGAKRPISSGVGSPGQTYESNVRGSKGSEYPNEHFAGLNSTEQVCE